ncbi:MAG: GNAT family N-acetyltransferase [Dysgonamonadaceae bacterium]|jgi:hypothetical protein|nr:GNAT family N-acetyltransferase [Dysgonamonadaceae bacterium]
MEDVIPQVDKKKVRAELTPDKLLRKTNKAGNEIYVFTHQDAPHTMQEVGRLREIAFRYYGGGTGLTVDIDEFDTMQNPYKQLIVWDPESEEILGGYRFLCGNDIMLDDKGQPVLATSHLFNFSSGFVEKYLPRTVELGRSFVSLEYQVTKNHTAKGLFVLDNLWDGLGALPIIDPSIQYFFGKVTMYNTYNTEARNMILYFLNLYFPDREKLVSPVTPLETNMDLRKMEKFFTGTSYKTDYKTLNLEVRRLGFNIPPLVNAYMNLSPKMKVFGTAVNYEFGEVEETGILIDVNEIFEEKKKRHIESFLVEKRSRKIMERIKRLISRKYAGGY